MSEKPKAEIDLSHVIAKKLAENVWLVGWLFQTHKSGEDTVRALADLYNAFDEAEAKKKAEAATDIKSEERS